MSPGGAASSDRVTFGLPLLHMATFPMHVAVVDQVQLLGSAITGTVLFDDAAIARASALGRNVAADENSILDGISAGTKMAFAAKSIINVTCPYRPGTI